MVAAVHFFGVRLTIPVLLHSESALSCGSKCSCLWYLQSKLVNLYIELFHATFEANAIL